MYISLIFCELCLCLWFVFSNWMSDLNTDDRQWTRYCFFKYWRVLPHKQSLRGHHHQVCQRVGFVAKIPLQLHYYQELYCQRKGKITLFEISSKTLFYQTVYAWIKLKLLTDFCLLASIFIVNDRTCLQELWEDIKMSNFFPTGNTCFKTFLKRCSKFLQKNSKQV